MRPGITLYSFSAREVIAIYGAVLLLGFAGGRYAPLPWLDAGREESLGFMLACVAISVGLGLIQSLVNRRMVTELRVLGEDLKQTSKQMRRDAGASR